MIFFSPGSWWPKEMHCQTLSRLLWTALLARRKRLGSGCCLQLFWDKRFFLLVSQARFARGIWCQSQNWRRRWSHPSLYPTAQSSGKDPCPKLGEQKKKKGFESRWNPSHADCRSLQANTHLPSSAAILARWFIQGENSFDRHDWRRPAAELPAEEQLRAHQRGGWPTLCGHWEWCLHCSWKCPDPGLWP